MADETPEIDQRLLDTLSKRVEVMVDERFKKVEKQIGLLQSTVDTYGNEASEDRKDIADIKVSMAGVKQEMVELRELIGKLQRTLTAKVQDTTEASIGAIGEKTAEAVQPIVQRTLEKFVQKKGTKIEPVIKKKPFWAFWRR